MSLLSNEDFTIWQLRTSYLAAIKDGIGDRLINVNSSILNSPGFRAAGWADIANANAVHIRRTYSPPIPTNTAVASGYFQASHRGNARDEITTVKRSSGLQLGLADDGDDEPTGLVTGGRRSPNVVNFRRRHGMDRKHGRRSRQNQRTATPVGARRDDSSDLSDESDESESAVQQIKFTKMPVRTRAGSSPIRSSHGRVAPEVLVTSPSVHSVDNRIRRSSLGAVETLKTRARRDTTTSSDLSTDNELDTGASPRSRQIQFSTEEEVIAPRDDATSEKLEEEEDEREEEDEEDEEDEEEEEEEGRMEVEMDELNRDDDWIAGSVGSAFSEFSATAGSGSLLNRVGIDGSLNGPSSSPLTSNKRPAAATGSPRKPKGSSTELQTLPPPRPISTVESTSALTALFKARKKMPANPFDQFAVLSGESATAPLYLKIYIPNSETPDKPMELVIARESKESFTSGLVIVAEAIGLALWKYVEEGIKPSLEGPKLNSNRWNLRMVEDGEVDYDFPPLMRSRPIVDFTSNNNRAGGLRGRARSKPYDEFALVEATPEEFDENEKKFPKFSTGPVDNAEEVDGAALVPTVTQTSTSSKSTRLHPILGQPFPSALNDSSLTPADLPAVPTTHATPRVGTMKTLKIRYIDAEHSTRMTTVNTSTGSYIAEILDSVSKKWGLDKGSFVLKVTGSNTMVPLDRTVEALGSISILDLVRRRFQGGPISLTGSPVSASPNAPLQVPKTVASKKGKKGKMLHPLSQQQDILGGYYRRYNVIRKQSMGITSSIHRVLVFDNDYMHIMPGESGKALWGPDGKTTSVAFSDVVGSKVSRRHPKSFRVVVLRGNDATEQKRYDFEAKNALEALEIVDEIKKNMKQYRIC
ncbi:hypothetical protein VTO42DRAFT_8034 [Malbranchea cinnamomea]